MHIQAMIFLIRDAVGIFFTKNEHKTKTYSLE